MCVRMPTGTFDSNGQEKPIAVVRIRIVEKNDSEMVTENTIVLENTLFFRVLLLKESSQFRLLAL